MPFTKTHFVFISACCGLIFLPISASNIVISQAYAQNKITSVQKNQVSPIAVLHEIQKNALQKNYQALIRIKNPQKTQHFKITHLFNGNNEYEKIVPLGVENRHILRVNQLVHVYQYDQKSMIADNRDDVSLPFLSTALDHLPKNYMLQNAPPERHLDKWHQIFWLKSQASDRYDYKLYVLDGMMMRMQTFWQGVVIEDSEIHQLEYIPYSHEMLEEWLSFGKDWRRTDRVFEKKQFLQRQNGQWLKHPLFRANFPSNFRGFIKKEDQAYPVALGKIARHIIYTDGMATFSVFAELATQTKAEGALTTPPINVYRLKPKNHFYTLVGEVPLEILENFGGMIQKIDENLP